MFIFRNNAFHIFLTAESFSSLRLEVSQTYLVGAQVTAFET